MAKHLYVVTFQDEAGEKFTRNTIASSEKGAIKNIKSESATTSGIVNWSAKIECLIAKE
ncbi:unnamed protein product [marine sediment metagenome]|uniref:Uncharacterized protein n=1 Tax=marine sediment metagenome TaxID=412755 RepID=X1F6H4_9ZZZZ